MNGPQTSHSEAPEKAPFFIVGCPRSGTSLLSRMLDRHPRLTVPYESHLFNTFSPLLDRYGSLAEPANRERLVRDILSTDVMADWDPPLSAEEVLSRIRGDSFCGVVAAVMDSWAALQNKPRWGEKTPHHLMYWRQIRSCFHRARFIHIIRDARDVALSLVAARFGPKNCYTAALLWNRYLAGAEELKAGVGGDSYLELRYEDLLAEPRETLTSICTFLEEEYDPGMMDFHREGGSYKTDERNLRNLRRPLLTDNAARWKGDMSPTDLRIVEAAAGEGLLRNGYPLSLENPRISGTERTYYRFVSGPLKKAVAMARNRKGQRDAWIRLLIGLRLRLRWPRG